MKQTACPTSTGARNISTAPSQLDRARAQARANNTVVWWITEKGAQLAFPSDSRTGEIWPIYTLGYGSVAEAEFDLERKGCRMEGLV
jgi:hypothetical protein